MAVRAGRRGLPRGTLDCWVRAYRDQGLDGPRSPLRAGLATMRGHPELLEEACQLHKELPARSAAQIAVILKARHGVRIPERTAGPFLAPRRKVRSGVATVFYRVLSSRMLAGFFNGMTTTARD